MFSHKNFEKINKNELEHFKITHLQNNLDLTRFKVKSKLSIDYMTTTKDS